MKLLLLTHGTFRGKDSVASGNSVRAYRLAKGLVENGIEVIYRRG
jgi:hypothetical protein